MDNCKLLLIATILLLLGYAWLIIARHTQPVEGVPAADMERLREQNDSLRQRNQTLDLERQRVQAQVDSLNHSMQEQKRDILTLKTIKHEKIYALDTVAPTALYHFFATFDTTGTRLGR